MRKSNMENQKNNIIRNDEYDLDHTHDDVETQTTYSENHTAENPNMATTGYVIEEEYEQLKRKNRRRLVGAGALVLVAGGLFAAASHTTPHATPTLAPETQAPVVANVTTDILLPGNGKTATNTASMENVVVDDSKNAPISMSHKIQAAAPLSEEEKNALAARQQRAKAQRLAQQRKLEAERAEHENNNINSSTVVTNNNNKTNSTNDDLRPKKAQALNIKVETDRKPKENTNINATTARDAQIAADKARAAERAKLSNNKTNNSAAPNKTSSNITASTNNNNADREKAAQEKLRAQRQAAEREKATSSKLTTNNSSTTINGKVTVQAGAFSDKALAQRIQQQLKSLNYSSHLEEVQTAKGSVYRVKTGKFANQNEAKGAIERLKSSGINGVVVIGQ